MSRAKAAHKGSPGTSNSGECRQGERAITGTLGNMELSGRPLTAAVACGRGTQPPPKQSPRVTEKSTPLPSPSPPVLNSYQCLSLGEPTWKPESNGTKCAICKGRLAVAESRGKRTEWGCRGKSIIFSTGTFLLRGMGHFQSKDWGLEINSSETTKF